MNTNFKKTFTNRDKGFFYYSIQLANAAEAFGMVKDLNNAKIQFQAFDNFFIRVPMFTLGQKKKQNDFINFCLKNNFTIDGNAA